MMLMGSIYKNALSWFFLEMDSFLCKVVQHAENAGEGIPHNFNVEKKKSKPSKQKTKLLYASEWCIYYYYYYW